MGCFIYDIGQEADKFGAGMAAGGFSLDLACFHVKGSLKRQRAVSMVFESVLFCAAGNSGSTGSRRSSAWIAVFSSTQKHGCMSRRFHVKADDFSRFLLKRWIVTGPIAI